MGVVTEGIIAMPYELVMADELTRMQFYQTVTSEIATLRARLETVEAETRERAVIAGWNACRKSVYAVCEDVAAEADRIRITTMVGSASEEQHAKGYHAGTCRAAKSIARGFNSMEAMDDDNCIAAIRNLEPRQ